MPLTILFVVLRAQIVRTVLGAGKFGWNDTHSNGRYACLVYDFHHRPKFDCPFRAGFLRRRRNNAAGWP